MKNKNQSPEIFICQCHSTDHQMIFLYSTEEIQGKEHNMCYVHVHLNRLPFWRRISYAIKYVFGRKSRYGAFDEFIFNAEDAERLQKVVDYLKKSDG